mmetsp:Transcript_14431/g.21686  ORF Transcript_14431/g.21686 Transcript_14431/m.21686 type:complete len:500 (+) Transcript_14431:98-1597(+)
MPSKNSQMIKDGKRLPLSGSSVVMHFLFTLVVLVPLLTVILIPLAVIFTALNFIKGLILPKKNRSKDNEHVDHTGSDEWKSNVSGSRRDFDLVLFGATGFTGRLAALYIARQYGSKQFRWAIAGRRKEGLEKIREELANIDPTLTDLSLIIADSSKPATLQDMARCTRVVITTTGPFDRYGSDLVRMCAESGTHYADITGETDWVRKMIDRYDDKARATGARIVHFCGHDCVPWDLTVMECANALKKSGETLTEVKCFDEINAGPSGGTMETVFHSLDNREKVKTGLGFDPMLKTLLGTVSTSKTVVKNPMSLGYAKEVQSWVGPFLMAMVNGNCVRRSNAVNNYGPSIKYSEATVYPSFMAGFVTIANLLVLGCSLAVPPLQWLLRKYFLPAPGQGPSEKSMDEGFLNVTAYARGSMGGTVKSEMYFPTDPGYRDTGRMLVESGLALALNEDDIACPGGVFTPAASIGSVLLKRLQATGTIFTVDINPATDSKKSKNA